MKIPVQWGPVIAKAWQDEAFKELLESNPATAFSQFGLTYEGSEAFTVPPRPSGLGKTNLRAGMLIENAKPACCSNSMFNANAL